jgi:hypothetical protein
VVHLSLTAWLLAGMVLSQPPQNLLTVPVHVYRVGDDDGRRQVTITTEQIAQLIEQVNRIYASAGIRLQFDPNENGPDVSTLRNTAINNLSSSASHDWVTANAIAAQHPGKLPVFFRNEAVPRGESFSFPAQSGSITNFVAMPGTAPTTGPLFAHEIGHYLGLYHTFPGWDDSATNTREKAADFITSTPTCTQFPWICHKSGTPNALDGDGLSDTPPDAGASFFAHEVDRNLCAGNGRYTISGTNIVIRGPLTNPIMEEVPFSFLFAPDRRNPMSNFPCEPRRFTTQQIDVLRHTVQDGRSAQDLTGTWTADDGGLYYIRQIANTVWWVGFSVESPGGVDDFHKGLLFTNVFRGTRTGDAIVGEFVDLPRGTILQNGPLRLDSFPTSAPGGIELRRREEHSPFGASVWRRSATTGPPCDFPCRFHFTRRNDGNTMEDHLASQVPVFDYHYVVFGTLNIGAAINFPPDVARTYTNFMCPGIFVNRDPWYLGFGDPPDGDIHFDMRAELEERDYRVELIMFGGAAGNKFCGDPVRFAIPPLLPGWGQSGSNSTLLNGRPINSQVMISPLGGSEDRCRRMLTDPEAGSCRLISARGFQLFPHTRVRVTGARVIDDHGHLEVHPVYSLEVLQDFQRPRPGASLTGVWSADDQGTYYVKQLDHIVWWLGVSRDRGATFANVFRGELNDTSISGEWADVPLGILRGAGQLDLQAESGPLSTALSKRAFTGDFGAHTWTKLYDVP